MKKSGIRLPAFGQPSFPYAESIAKINRVSFCNLNDDELKHEAERIRGRKTEGEEEWIAAFALVKEVIFRLIGLRLFDTQLAAAVSMRNGRVAELPTGEGKTLSAVLLAAVWALSGRNVHVLVFNDYLAKRDSLFAEPVFTFLGLRSGCIRQTMLPAERRAVYAGNIVYASAKEVGFDFLRDFLSTEQGERLPIRQDCAIVDEADSIMIDEARIPLVLAGDSPEEMLSASFIARTVDRLPTADVVVNRPANQVYLNDDGIQWMETELRLQNLYAPENINLLSMVNAALQACYLLARDKDYLVREHSVKIIDEFTGRISENRRYPDILHAAVEAREKLNTGTASMVYNTIAMQDFLLRYQTLCGMTGTAKTSAEEIGLVYGLPVDVIPPHQPCRRVDHEDVLLETNAAKLNLVVEEIRRAHGKGQPVLVGTQSVRESELVSGLLRKAEIPHRVLNARNDEAEAGLIARAGEPGRVTISTNMAGRGVDIRLGGEREQQKETVLAAGGLYVIGTGMNRSIRIDNQLRGRAGRQGDVGESRFFISLEDPLMVQYGLEREHKKAADGLVTDRRMRRAVRRVQKYAEGEDAEARYMLSRYSYLQEEQRRVITELRDAVLNGEKRLSGISGSDPEYYGRLTAQAGEQGVAKAEKQLALYYINLHWAQYLESMEYVRDGIHLVVIGGKSPVNEYHRTAIAAFDEMMRDIVDDVAAGMRRFRITSSGIDMESGGLKGATATWTYLIDDSNTQFSRIPHLVNTVSNQVRGTVFTVQGLFRKAAGKLRGN
jgi:preprotein translocase subunit SecA